MEIDNLEEKILRDNRSIKPLDVFFLLCVIPEVKGHRNKLVIKITYLIFYTLN